MASKIKLFLAFFVMSLSFVGMYSEAATCPDVKTINRIQGEYLWATSDPGWTGYFVAPVIGKGRSYKITNFIGATWVKSHDTANSAGFIQCDYSGDFIAVVDKSKYYYKDPNNQEDIQQNQDSNQNQDDGKIAVNEVVRFVQSNANSSLPPTAKNNTWSCLALTKFPKEACRCFGKIEKCNFRLG